MFRNLLIGFILIGLTNTAVLAATPQQPNPPKPAPPNPSPPPNPNPSKNLGQMANYTAQSTTNNILNRTRSLNIANLPQSINAYYFWLDYNSIAKDTLPQLLVFWGDSLYEFNDLRRLLAIDSSVTAGRIDAVLKENSKIDVTRTPKQINEPVREGNAKAGSGI
jgi:hypothetical protein